MKSPRVSPKSTVWMRTRTIVCGLSLPMLCGCGGGDGVRRVPVTGMVTVDGTPLPKGKVVFTPVDGNASLFASAPVSAGRFEVPETFGPIPGRQRVEIISTDDGGYAPDDEAAMERWIAGGRKPIRIVKIPRKYLEDGSLLAEVNDSGPNQFAFDLVSREK